MNDSESYPDIFSLDSLDPLKGKVQPLTASEQVQKPAAYVSLPQLEALNDPEGEYGNYLPVRKTPLGLFSQPLYTTPQPTSRHPACKPNTKVNGGALKLALNVLRRAGKDEIADELEATAEPVTDIGELKQDLQHAIDKAKKMGEQLALLEGQIRGDVWRWQADGSYNLASMSNNVGVLIYASDLRNLIASASKGATDWQIMSITTAYEQGVGKGRQAYAAGKEIENPYLEDIWRCNLAWKYGYYEGKSQAAGVELEVENKDKRIKELETALERLLDTNFDGFLTVQKLKNMARETLRKGKAND